MMNFISIAAFKTKVTRCFTEYYSPQYKKDKLSKQKCIRSFAKYNIAAKKSANMKCKTQR